MVSWRILAVGWGEAAFLRSVLLVGRVFGVQQFGLLFRSRVFGLGLGARVFGLSARRCGRGFRALVFVGGALGLGLLVVARFLAPASSGLGTHQQLGLPPCSMRVLFGIRCPACGMTTSWSWLTRGDLVASAQASLSGMLLGLFVLSLVVVAFRVAWFGRWPVQEANWWMGLGVVLVGVLSAVEWLVRLRLG